MNLCLVIPCLGLSVLLTFMTLEIQINVYLLHNFCYISEKVSKQMSYNFTYANYENVYWLGFFLESIETWKINLQRLNLFFEYA